jgi:hypothetical protein
MNARSLHFVAVGLVSLGAAHATQAQSSNVAAGHKYAWGENIGFINFRDAGSPSASQGVRIYNSFFGGYAWGENVGWINFGDGSPANGVSYANPTVGPIVGVPDFGVNRNPTTGNLTGFAWGENIGWINFGGGALATPAQPARVDNAAHRLRGFAWGENVGWINLDNANIYVGTCPADFNGNGTLEVQDIFDFLNAWFAGNPTSDFNGGGLAVQDIFDFLNAWFAGC